MSSSSSSAATCGDNAVSSSDTSCSSDACVRIIDGMKRKMINFLAVDFDLTLCSIHTAGRYKGTPAELVNMLRPFMVQLLRCALENGIMVAVVTFSGQTGLIAATLALALTPEVAARIILRCNDGKWDHGNTFENGKQLHIASAAERIAAEHRVRVTRSSTLFIDDDMRNVRIALRNDIRSIWYDPADHPPNTNDDGGGRIQRELLEQLCRDSNQGQGQTPASCSSS